MDFDESGSNAVHVGCAAHAAQGLRRRPIPIVLSLHSTGRATIARLAGAPAMAALTGMRAAVILAVNVTPIAFTKNLKTCS